MKLDVPPNATTALHLWTNWTKCYNFREGNFWQLHDGTLHLVFLLLTLNTLPLAGLWLMLWWYFLYARLVERYRLWPVHLRNKLLGVNQHKHVYIMYQSISTFFKIQINIMCKKILHFSWRLITIELIAVAPLN